MSLDLLGGFIPGLTPIGAVARDPAQPLSQAERDYLLLVQTRFLVAPVYPVLLAQNTESGSTVYLTSRRIPWPFVVRWYTAVLSTLSGPDENNRLDIRVTEVGTEDQAAYDAGVSLYAPFSDDLEVSAAVEAALLPLWVPFHVRSGWIVARLRSTGVLSTQVATIQVGITPLEAVVGPLEV